MNILMSPAQFEGPPAHRNVEQSVSPQNTNAL